MLVLVRVDGGKMMSVGLLGFSFGLAGSVFLPMLLLLVAATVIAQLGVVQSQSQ